MVTKKDRAHQINNKGLAIQVDQIIDSAGNAVDVTSLSPLSSKAVAGGATYAVTAADADRNLLFDTLAGTKFTLPAATGSGLRFKFVLQVVPTSNQHQIATDNTGTFYGVIEFDKAGTVTNYTSAGTNKSIQLNGSTTGGAQIGDQFEVVDVAADKWAVTGFTQASGTLATPFSSTIV